MPVSLALRTRGLPRYDAALLQKWDESLQSAEYRREFSKLLNKVPLFAHATDKFRLELPDAFVPMEYGPVGSFIFRQGERGDWMALVLSGRLETKVHQDPEHGDVRLKEIPPGGIVGDMSLLGISNHRTFSASTLAPSTLLLISRPAFEAIVESTCGEAEYALARDAWQSMQGLTGDTRAFCELKCFERLERDFVSALCEKFVPQLMYPGAVMMKEGDSGHEMFMLQAGLVKVEKNNRMLAELGGGIVLGELAVLGSDKRRSATVTCTRLSLVYSLHADVVHQLLEKFPRSRQVFDHEFVARLLKFGMDKVSDEVETLNNFYGKAHPRTRDDVMQNIFGQKDDEFLMFLEDSKSPTSLPQVTVQVVSAAQ